MKVRIVNNEPQGIFPNDYLEKNSDKIINGQLVSQWQLTEVLPNENLLKPFWNGTQWIEGATAEEIAEQELEQQKILKQQQYEELLPTDWYVIRFMETGVEIPEDILKLRKQIREKY